MFLPGAIRRPDGSGSTRTVGDLRTTGPARLNPGALAVHYPVSIGTFEFVVVSSLRAAQLMRGCTPRVESLHKRTITAQLEVAAGEIVRVPATATIRSAE